jgi:hypothetical protein
VPREHGDAVADGARKRGLVGVHGSHSARTLTPWRALFSLTALRCVRYTWRALFSLTALRCVQYTWRALFLLTALRCVRCMHVVQVGVHVTYAREGHSVRRLDLTRLDSTRLDLP